MFKPGDVVKDDLYGKGEVIAAFWPTLGTSDYPVLANINGKLRRYTADGRFTLGSKPTLKVVIDTQTVLS